MQKDASHELNAWCGACSCTWHSCTCVVFTITRKGWSGMWCACITPACARNDCRGRYMSLLQLRTRRCRIALFAKGVSTLQSHETDKNAKRAKWIFLRSSLLLITLRFYSGRWCDYVTQIHRGREIGYAMCLWVRRRF